MNTLAHIGALVSIGLLIKLAFVDMSDPILGTAGVVMFAVFVVMTLLGLLADHDMIE